MSAVFTNSNCFSSILIDLKPSNSLRGSNGDFLGWNNYTKPRINCAMNPSFGQ